MIKLRFLLVALLISLAVALPVVSSVMRINSSNPAVTYIADGSTPVPTPQGNGLGGCGGGGC